MDSDTQLLDICSFETRGPARHVTPELLLPLWCLQVDVTKGDILCGDRASGLDPRAAH